MQTRNAASVLPEPVGAATSVSRPAATCGHASSWGAVGPSGKRRRNHSATAGCMSASAGCTGGPAGSRGRGTAVMLPILADGCDTHPGPRPDAVGSYEIDPDKESPWPG